MTTYAQTNVQLFNQLRSEGYSRDDRQFVFESYELAARLFSGLFLPSGKPFLDHLVGTASVLASLHVPIDIVAAGLLHATYQHGDFGDARIGLSGRRRQAVRNAVGPRVEDYVARYYLLVWDSVSILNASAGLETWERADREVLLIRVANELEHHLDFGALYFNHTQKLQAGHQRYMKSYIPVLTDISERLGFPSLAAELKSVWEETLLAQLPIEPCIKTDQVVAYFVAPKSYRKRLIVRGVHTMQRIYRFPERFLRRAKTVYRNPGLVFRRFVG